MKKRNNALRLVMIALLTTLTGCQQSSTSTEEIGPTPLPASDVVPVDTDYEYAKKVIDMIDSLNQDSTKEDIEAIVEAYNKLTERQKSMVTNYSLLKMISDAISLNNSLMSIDIDNYDINEIFEIRKEYDAFIDLYGQENANRIKSEEYANLEKVELKIVNNIIADCLQIDTNEKIGFTRFFTLFNEAISLYDYLKDDLKSKVVGYNDLLSKKEELETVGEVTFDGNYSLSNKILPTTYNEKYGILHTFSSVGSAKDYEIDLDIGGEDWRYLSSISFFIKSDSEINDRSCLIVNGSWSWDHTIRIEGDPSWSSPTLVNADEYVYYYNISLDGLNEEFSLEKKSSIHIYFGAATNVKTAQISSIVGKKKDYSQINALVNKINEIDISTNAGKAKFALQNQIVGALINERDKNYITGYDTYITKVNEVKATFDVIYDGKYTTYFSGNYYYFEETSNTEFGYLNSLTLPGESSTNSQIFLDTGKGNNWSAYNHLALFAEFDCPIASNPALCVPGNGINSTGTATKIGNEGNLYYLEFPFNFKQVLTDNPFAVVTYQGSNKNIKISRWVGIK